MDKQTRVLISQIDPPKDFAIIEEYLNTRTGERVALHRGMTIRSEIDRLKEAFPEGCFNCCGITWWKRLEQGKEETLFGSTFPRLHIDYRDGHLCVVCKRQIAKAAENRFRTTIKALKWLAIRAEPLFIEMPSPEMSEEA